MGRCGATQGRTRAVSACPTRAMYPALSRPCTLPTRRRNAELAQPTVRPCQFSVTLHPSTLYVCTYYYAEEPGWGWGKGYV